MLIISFAGMGNSPANAGEWWEERLKKVEESQWLQHIGIQHRMCWPPMGEDGYLAWGRSVTVCVLAFACSRFLLFRYWPREGENWKSTRRIAGLDEVQFRSLHRHQWIFELTGHWP